MQAKAGMRIEPPPSLACAAGTMPAETAAAAPPEEPPALRSRSHGLWVAPKSVDSLLGDMNILATSTVDEMAKGLTPT